MRRLSLFIVLIVLIVVVSQYASCTRTPTDVTLPEGEQTFTGTLERAVIARGRRGTHLLQLQDGTKCCLVESSVVNLRSLEGVVATFKGTFEQNIDPSYLPVLVISAASARGLETRKDTLTSIGITLSVPADWDLALDEATSTARYTLSGASVLTVQLKPTNELPTGGSIGIGTRIGIRTEDALSGAQAAYLPYNGGVLALRFTPIAERNDLEARYRRVLSSVVFDKQSTTPIPTSTGTGSGRGCGGIAGFVCPDGQYCQVSGSGAAAGICVPL